jgi:hypothetical protein
MATVRATSQGPDRCMLSLEAISLAMSVPFMACRW